MIDPRIYRAGFIPALAAVVAVLFSVEPLPNAIQAPAGAESFDGGDAAAVTRNLLDVARERSPGSAGDRAAAALVEERFASATAGIVSEQSFETSFDGEDREATNLILTLPGESERTILVVAPRESALGPGAASSASATAILVELAAQLGSSTRDRTLVLLSAGGGSDGAKGMREFLDSFGDPELIDAAIVIGQTGVPRPEPPFVLTNGADAELTGPRLTESALRTVSTETDQRASRPGLWSELARLALPLTFGEQSVLLDEGINAVAISAHGERPLPPSADERDSFSPVTQANFGRAALALVLALDANRGSPDAGPEEHVTLDGTMIPGWALMALALALVVPAAATAADAAARAYRRDRRFPAALASVLGGSLVFIAPLAFVYMLGFVGLIPRPSAPFDPGRFPAGWEGVVTLLLLATAAVGAALLTRPLAVPYAAAETASAAAGAVAALALVGLWLLNPYLVLLLFPAAHVWLLAARIAGPAPPALIAGAAALSLLPALAAIISVADAFDLGLEAPWQALLALTSGQVGLIEGVLLALLGASLLAAVAAGRAEEGADPGAPAISIRGPSGYAGPGSLGGTESEIARR